jgi:N-acetylmuramic acid 6-phosphate etherase
MTTPDDNRAAADAFLREAAQFHLGALPTETPHPATRELSRLAREDVPAALRLLRDVDLAALAQARSQLDRIAELRDAITDTLAKKQRVFLCGCGATGRLSISLETLWRESNRSNIPGDAVRAFMAGGDVALVHSIENFEDLPSYGARQLEELGFVDGDLLISTTEGGETPFVIGATERAAAISSRAPWFLYCNPDEALAPIERSRRVLENDRIRKISLFAGPMALSGSTRMQASTVLQLAVGIALLPYDNVHLAAAWDELSDALRAVDVAALAPFVERESRQYQEGGFVSYETEAYGITILTDTTERAPTFSLRGFENRNDEVARLSLCYFHRVGTADAVEAWHKLLRRRPRPLDWPDVERVAGSQRLLGFDFSDAGAAARLERLGGKPSLTFSVQRHSDAIQWRLDELDWTVPLSRASLLTEHLLLKCLLNMHSTLVMGRLGRYEGNLMTYVRPSNKKLIDRAIRYVRHLMPGASYETVAYQCFEEMSRLGDDEPIVLRVAEALRR